MKESIEKELNLFQLRGIDLKDLLKTKLGHSNDFIEKYEIYYHYFITTALKQYMFYGSGNKNGYVKIFSGKLRCCMPKLGGNQNRTYLLYIIEEDLEKLNIAKTKTCGYDDNGYKSPKYTRIDALLLKKGFKILDNPQRFNNYKKLKDKHFGFESNPKKKKKEIPLKKYHLEMKMVVQNLTLDTVRAKEALDYNILNNVELPAKRIKGKIKVRKFSDPYIKDYYNYIIDTFNDIDTFEIKGKTGRVYSRLTNLPRFLRQFLLYKGEPIVLKEVDVANSQPLMFCLVLLDYYRNKEIPTDVERYIERCQNGTFYNNLKSQFIASNIKVCKDKQIFKVDVFSRIFFNKNYGAPFEIGFKSIYPNVFKVLSELKSIKENEVAIRLQRAESNLIIKKCARKLVNLGMCIFTLHDGIFVIEGDIEQSKEIIKEEFRLVGLNPRLEIK